MLKVKEEHGNAILAAKIDFVGEESESTHVPGKTDAFEGKESQIGQGEG